MLSLRTVITTKNLGLTRSLMGISMRYSSTLKNVAATGPAPKLTTSDLNPYVRSAKYAVRGRIPAKAEELKKQLASDPSSLPFKKVINANIGNPQQLDQQPLSFYRRVLALIEDPELLSNKTVISTFPKDVVKRAQELLECVKSVGAYSNSQGISVARKHVAEYISKRDGYPSNADDIFLTAGASTAVQYLIQLLSNGPKTGFLIPIPQYPLYTAAIALNNTVPLPYYLQEEQDWSVDSDEIVGVIEKAISQGIKPRCLVVINPGNPTAAILKHEALAKLFQVAAKYGILVIADEVYQENVYRGEFVSAKKVLRDIQTTDKSGFYDNVQLASLHSTSKGLSGECGHRGGYMELVGLDPSVKAELLKLASISLCGPVTGQSLVSLMVNPPHKGEESYDLDQQQRRKVYNDLATRAKKLYESFNEMEGASCRNPMGAMYCFPKLELPEKAIAEAKKQNMTPDTFYAEQLLLNTGICTVPGSGFGQKEGTYHVRTTFLPPGTQWVDDWKKFQSKFMKEFS